jgi:hypothetical protein
MAKDFNVYQWRRNHLNENVDETFSTKQYREDDKINNFTNNEKNDYLSTNFQNQIGLNEEDGIMVSTITFEDLAKYGADRLPWDAVSGAFLEATKQKAFDEWKDRFIRLYGDSKLEVKNGRLHPVGNQKWDQFSQSGGDIMRAAVGTVD